MHRGHPQQPAHGRQHGLRLGRDFCNGSGACVDCTMASQCGTSTFCQTFTCNSNTCGTSNTANGTDLPMGSQTAGNCQVLECNGAGSTISTAFNSDVPVDGNACTSDVCTSGVPSNPAAPANTACGSGDFWEPWAVGAMALARLKTWARAMERRGAATPLRTARSRRAP
ncbi:MAG: hypothetical protein IPG81_01565 [Sandaracinaceae bacterium]|nr:hypothetical protein [Sandaracinaceae bacterium]